MRLAIVSDTHMCEATPDLEKVYEAHLVQADMLVHCGDMTGEDVYHFLARHPGFMTVRGNCDFYPSSEDLPVMASMVCEGFRIGVGHGWGPRSIVGETVAGALGPGYDFVFYGHTHQRDWRRLENGTWLLNPGSMSEPRYGEGPSLALLDIGQGHKPVLDWILL
ncbi:MAG: metallophosphoesterase [Deltaproteobacteria bacterium]|nr:metallophosphoesterase [Deltaproteobacteria bacterium]